MVPFYGWGSTASRLEPLRGGSLLFTTEFPDIWKRLCQATLKQGLIEESFKFISGSSLQYVPTLKSLVTIGIVIVEMFLICHVTHV